MFNSEKNTDRLVRINSSRQNINQNLWWIYDRSNPFHSRISPYRAKNYSIYPHNIHSLCLSRSSTHHVRDDGGGDGAITQRSLPGVHYKNSVSKKGGTHTKAGELIIKSRDCACVLSFSLPLLHLQSLHELHRDANAAFLFTSG